VHLVKTTLEKKDELYLVSVFVL